MGGLAFLIPTLALIALSVMVVKVGSVALRMTGLDTKRATFQSLSAFTGTGFTTRDSELVVRDDRRRRVIMTLMILGNAGFVGVLATLIGTFVTARKKSVEIPIQLVAILLCIFLMYLIGRRKRLMRRWSAWIERRLARWTSLQEIPVEEAFHLAEGYGVAAIRVRSDSEVIGRSLAEKALAEKDVLILAIEREGQTIPAPKAKEVIQKGDRLICYGKLNVMREIL